MDADICCQSARFCQITLPGYKIPAATGGDVGEVDIELRRARGEGQGGISDWWLVEIRWLVDGGCVNLLFEGDDGGVVAQLKNSVNLSPDSFSISFNASTFQGFKTSGFSQIASAPTLRAKRIWASWR